MRRTLLVCVAVLVASGCHRGGSGQVLDAGTPVVDAGPPPPPELSITLRVPQPDGGTDEFPLSVDDVPTIPVVQSLEIVTNEPLRNSRIRVLDEADRVLASDEQIEASDAGIRDQLQFPQPLLGGHKYVVVLDAQNPGDVLDPRGKVVLEKHLTFQTGGEREQPPAPAKKKPAKHHRHRHH